MFKFICVILSNAIHNIFYSEISKVSWTKLYMLDDHYECTIVYTGSCDIIIWLFWSKTGPKYTLNCSKSLMGGLYPRNPPMGLCPCNPMGASASRHTPCLGRITVSYAPAVYQYTHTHNIWPGSVIRVMLIVFFIVHDEKYENNRFFDMYRLKILNICHEFEKCYFPLSGDQGNRCKTEINMKNFPQC
jgi:hypothetical protein